MSHPYDEYSSMNLWCYADQMSDYDIRWFIPWNGIEWMIWYDDNQLDSWLKLVITEGKLWVRIDDMLSSNNNQSHHPFQQFNQLLVTICQLNLILLGSNWIHLHQLLHQLSLNQFILLTKSMVTSIFHWDRIRLLHLDFLDYWVWTHEKTKNLVRWTSFFCIVNDDWFWESC